MTERLQIYFDRYGTDKVTVRSLPRYGVTVKGQYTPTKASRRRLEDLTYSGKYSVRTIIGPRDFDVFISRRVKDVK